MNHTQLNFALDAIVQTRKNMIYVLNQLAEQSNYGKPMGFNNHPLWNFGHSVTTFCMLTYGLSNLPIPLSPEFVLKYKKGSTSTDFWSLSELEEVKNASKSAINQLIQDLTNQTFVSFSPYQTSYGSHLSTIEEAIVFNLAHEGLHLGYIMAQKRVLLA